MMSFPTPEKSAPASGRMISLNLKLQG